MSQTLIDDKQFEYFNEENHDFEEYYTSEEEQPEAFGGEGFILFKDSEVESKEVRFDRGAIDGKDENVIYKFIYFIDIAGQ